MSEPRRPTRTRYPPAVGYRDEKEALSTAPRKKVTR